jgi:hypothetical protein
MEARHRCSKALMCAHHEIGERAVMNLKPEDDFEMEDEYDFSNAERGKFYSPNSTYT